MSQTELAAELRLIAEKLQKASCAIDMYSAAAQLKSLAQDLDRNCLDKKHQARARPDAGHHLGE